jgi:predicted DNA-binding transcriptional regulator YafY
MSKHGTIRRYTLLIEKIRRGAYPSFKDLKAYLFDHGFEVSNRTIQRDIEQIRFEFGIEIAYDRYKNGYYLDVENSLDIESFFGFLEVVNTAELLTESLQDTKNGLKHIAFDTGGGLKGIDHLKPLLKAIKEQRKITFTHFNFHTEKSKPYRLKPYLLKEYQNRWYVVGLVGNSKEFRTFGIDRIEDLKLLTDTFQPDHHLDPNDRFRQTIGLVYSERPPERIVLSFTPKQGNYIKTLPLHSSQHILLDNKQECRIALTVAPNYELIQEIMKHGDTVKVVEPQWLANDIKAILKRSLEQY